MESTSTPAHTHPAGFQRRSLEKKRYAASISSTIISSPPKVIQWLMNPVMRWAM